MRRTLLHLCIVVLVYFAFFPVGPLLREETVTTVPQPAPANVAPTRAVSVVDLVRDAGLPPVFVAIARCESNLDPAAGHLNPNGSRDDGLWQIDDRWWKLLFEDVDPYDPVDNAVMAAAVYDEQGLTAWVPLRSCWDQTTTAVPPQRDCTPSIPSGFRMARTDAVTASVELSAVAYRCAPEVGLAPVGDPQAAATLAAAGIDGPLLLVSDRLTRTVIAELERLAPTKVLVAGVGDEIEQALFGFDVRFVEVDPEAVHTPPTPVSEQVRLVGSQAAVLSSPGSEAAEVWLIDPDTVAAPLAVTAANMGAVLVIAEPDLRALPTQTRQLITRSEKLRLMSELGPEAVWQLDVVRRNAEIPGGGLLLFDEDIPRRLVAIYGHPTTPLLGVLGEQDPEESIKRLAEIAAGYETDSTRILPTFEIIATVASAEAGKDGDYSAATSRDVIRPWIETAADNGLYVVLDLQPGRTDFLTQAKLYEEFLRLPHVGLALDPEWRLKPHQVHLQQIGTVDAEEINRVMAWLAAIVREEALPQKLLIVHQFRLSMITNRARINTPPELAVVIQMDGQGALEVKHNTWNALTRDTEHRSFRWGWKNFYDEDTPTATPTQVLELTPVPVFVSYQ